MRAFLDANDQLPPMHAISAHFGWESANSAQTHVFALERRGYLERNAVGKWRLTDKGRANTITDRDSSQHTAEFPTNGSLQPMNGSV
jgi:SOS-response transcriptional repressor LexA